MKKNLLWMLAAWMLAMVTVICSNDENYVEESIKVIGGAEVAYVPANMDELPGWLQEWILTETAQGVGYLLCEGTWDGRRAYYLWYPFTSTLGWFCTYEGVYLASYGGIPDDPEFIEKGGGWDKWTCIAYHHPV
ncbi:hypothetical protein [uncultured Muribaculum sp.]|uniref:hypothetical protein n=1 Tax=uncultured Muribaculum sp. TaxID=1918613 RepID=UPI0025B742FB|nr:hypothetical protein [uncultured Muribaculum sp.]